MEQIQTVKKFFLNDRYAMATTGIDILEVGEHYAKTILKISEGLLNGAGKVMGGAIFTLADFTFAVSANVIDEVGEVTEKVVTTNSSITYLSSPKGDILFGESRLIKNGRSTCTYEIRITDNLENLVAIAISNGMKL